MDDIISKLSAIEDRAMSILDDANEEKEKLAQQMKEKTLKWDASIQKETKQKISDIEKKARESFDKDIAKQRAYSSQIIISLQEDYEKNHKEYVNELFKKMIKE